VGLSSIGFKVFCVEAESLFQFLFTLLRNMLILIFLDALDGVFPGVRSGFELLCATL